ncbi:MAG: hypothetical protein JWP05_560 [Microbacteriaceae bacterium]|nr:hypothetical protein [Microbacteriaceae bacterium]
MPVSRRRYLLRAVFVAGARHSPVPHVDRRCLTPVIDPTTDSTELTSAVSAISLEPRCYRVGRQRHRPQLPLWTTLWTIGAKRRTPCEQAVHSAVSNLWVFDPYRPLTCVFPQVGLCVETCLQLWLRVVTPARQAVHRTGDIGTKKRWRRAYARRHRGVLSCAIWLPSFDCGYLAAATTIVMVATRSSRRRTVASC